MKTAAPLVLCPLAILPALFPSGADRPPAPIAVTIRVDASKIEGPLPPIWRFFGADEPNYAYMKDGQKLLAELGRLRPALGLLPDAQPADLRRRHARP